jgi:dTDP-4-dehydrorhamnose 3,5-epimerase
VNSFNVIDLPLAGLKMVNRRRLGDPRGFLSRLFCAEELATVGWSKSIAQINYTYTAKQGTVRGLHFQRPPHSEMKLVTCIRGEVWDIAVDVRVNSLTFLQWHAEYLSAENGNAFLIPEGFAHGFQTMTDDVELIYCHSAAYCVEAEAGLNAQDPNLAIPWKKAITELSERDKNHPFIETSFTGVLL